jgi:hypothetical protein
LTKGCLYISSLIDTPGLLRVGCVEKEISRASSAKSIISTRERERIIYIKEASDIKQAFKEINEKLTNLCVVKRLDEYHLISATLCIDLIREIAGNTSPEVYDQKYYLRTNPETKSPKEIIKKITKWKLLGAADNYNIYLGGDTPRDSPSTRCCAIMFSAGRKRRGQKPFQSEKSFVRYIVEENQYEYLYFSLFEKCMGTGEMVFEDIIYPPIRLDAHMSEMHRIIIEHLSKR